ncbi:MAG: hypothetical protein AAB969_01240 [Patescibacteria group bacterium]
MSSLIITSLFLSGCIKQTTETTNNNLIIADEKFCITHTESNISSEEAFKIASQSECAQAGVVKEDCSCDSNTYNCSFSIAADKPDCDPVCIVNLKTQAVKLDLQCTNDSSAGE